MTRQTTLRKAALTLVGVTAVMVTLVGASASADRDPIVGTWDTTVAVTGGAPFQAIESFIPGGVFTFTRRVTNVGIWKRTDDHTYVYEFTGFDFDAGGQLVSIRNNYIDLTLVADDLYTATFTLVITDPDGGFLRSIDGTREGHRRQFRQ